MGKKILKGGQGRSEQEIERDATMIVITVVMFALCGVCAILAALIPWKIF